VLDWIFYGFKIWIVFYSVAPSRAPVIKLFNEIVNCKFYVIG